MRKNIINLSIAILIILVVLGCAKYFVMEQHKYRPADIKLQNKTRALEAKKDKQFLIYNSVSSISGLNHWKTHLGKSLQNIVAPYGGQVEHQGETAPFIADHWAFIINNMNNDIDVFILEINAFLYNERRSIFTTADPQSTLRFENNISAILSQGSLSTQYGIWLQYGFEPWLSNTLKHYYNPYFLGTSQQRHRRKDIRKIAINRIHPWIRPMSQQIQIYRDNFVFKDYQQGTDTDVLNDMLAWLPKHPNLPVVIYFPPMNVPLLIKASGNEAWERFRRFRIELGAHCHENNILFLDLTEHFGADNSMFSDYGHFKTNNKGRIAFDSVAGSLFAYLKTNHPIKQFIKQRTNTKQHR